MQKPSKKAKKAAAGTNILPQKAKVLLFPFYTRVHGISVHRESNIAQGYSPLHLLTWALLSVAKYLIGPPLLKFGPKSDQFFQQNQTLPVIVKKFTSYSQSMHHQNLAKNK